MSDIPAFPYALLWGERSIRSVANLTRADAREFLDIAARVPIRTETVVYELEEANRALEDLRRGAFTGAAVLRVGAVGSGWHSRTDDRESNPRHAGPAAEEPDHAD